MTATILSIYFHDIRSFDRPRPPAIHRYYYYVPRVGELVELNVDTDEALSGTVMSVSWGEEEGGQMAVIEVGR